MSSEFITLLAALGAGIVLSVGAVVWWVNRTPTVERTGEALPLFGGMMPGERPAVAAPAPRLAPSSPPSNVPPAEGAVAPAMPWPPRVAAPVPPQVPPQVPPSGPPSGPTYVPAYVPALEAREETVPPRPRPVIREFVSGVDPAPMYRGTEPAVAAAPAEASVVNAAGVPGTMVEGHALRFSVPADGTLQFLPGRFEIGSGLDAGREIRFVRVEGPNDTEVTFGRAEGELYRHIQLRDKTVSRAHARMHHARGAWHLENLSQTNPVVHNGVEMPSAESRQLRDGDRIEMGEVQFTFRER